MLNRFYLLVNPPPPVFNGQYQAVWNPNRY